ncbi:MAG: acetylornithine transaminase [Micrococcaceae bacterium]
MNTPHTSGEQLMQRYRNALTGVFGTPQRTLVRGEGVTVWDADGRAYTDLLAGIAVNALGHAHPRLVAAVTEQLSTLGHVSNFFTSVPQIQLAERLLELAGAEGTGGTVFFANSGTEANEAAFKLARRHGDARRSRILAVEHSFHGRTMGALALTWKEQYRAPFAPLPGGVEHLPFGDQDAMISAIDDTVAAVILEPVQGESGVHAAPAGYLQAVREACTRHGALLIFDEVQSGMGRTGTWFAHQNPAVTGGAPVIPDAMTLAKGLGGGIPIGALVCFTAATSQLLTAGQHGTTFGGNPMATAAGLAVIEVIEAQGLLQHVADLGAAIDAAVAGVEEVSAVRAFGGLIGLDLHDAVAPAVVAAALEAGWIVNATGPSTLRLAPPLIIDADTLTAFLRELPALITHAQTATETQTETKKAAS